MEEKAPLRIAMAVTNDLVTDRRVDRHCRTMVEAGCDVLLIGRELPGSEEVRRQYGTRRMKLKHRRGPLFYAEYNRRLTRLLVEAEPDVVWANDSDTLAGCFAAVRRLRRRGGRPALVMDAHELFTEVPELIGRPLVREVWAAIERRVMPECDVLLTVSNGVAEEYGRRYGVRMEVVRNVGEVDRLDEGMRESLTGEGMPMLLYQGSVNVGRGVDWAIDAMEWLPRCRLVVAGEGDELERMKAYAASKTWSERIEFLGRLTPEALKPLTRRASVGLVMLEDRGLNYHYALPNRVGDFVAAGVPMVVSDLPEMASVVRRYGVGEVMAAPGGKALSEAVERVLARGWEEADFVQARRELNWEEEKKKLTSILKKLKNRERNGV